MSEQAPLPSSDTRPFTREAQPVLTSQEQELEKPSTLYNRKYRQTEKGNEAARRAGRHYDQSPKGKERHQRYQQSEKGKAAYNRYTQSEKGRKTASEGNKRRYEARK